MSDEGKNMERRSWLAAALGLAMPGLGQIYNGELVKGISCFAVFLALFAVGFRWTVFLPDGLLIIGALATITIGSAAFILIAIDAYRTAGRTGTGFRPAVYNRWYFYLAVWLLGSVLVTGSVYTYTKHNVLEAYKIVTASMEPAVLRGDRVFADKTAYHRMPPKRGDIIVFVYPDDRSKVFMKRIEALPGDEIVTLNGGKETVPHGMVYVLGDNQGQSVDSRTFGFVPLRDVIGKVRQVYYSSGDDGARWSRIGSVPGRE